MLDCPWDTSHVSVLLSISTPSCLLATCQYFIVCLLRSMEKSGRHEPLCKEYIAAGLVDDSDLNYGNHQLTILKPEQSINITPDDICLWHKFMSNSYPERRWASSNCGLRERNKRTSLQSVTFPDFEQCIRKGRQIWRCDINIHEIFQ